MNVNREPGKVAHRLQFILDNTPDIIWVYDIRINHFSYVSPAVEPMLGYTQEEAVNLPFDVWMPKHSVKKVEELISAGVPYFKENGEYSGVQELEVFHKNGSTVWVELTTKYQIDPDTGLLEIVGSTRDITRVKELEFESRKGQDRLREAVGMAKLGAWEYDLNKRELSFSKECYEIHGVNEETFVNTAEEALGLVHEEDRQGVVEAFEQVRTHGRVVPVSFRINRQDNGEMRYLLVSGSADGRTEEGVNRIYGFSQDVTTQRLAEQELIESRERYRSVFNMAPIALAEISAGRFDRVNQQFCELFDCDADELLDVGFTDIVLGGSFDEYEQIVNGKGPTDVGTLEIEKEYKACSGKIIWGATRFNVILDGDGRVDHLVVAIKDVTEEKRIRKQLERHRETLEAQVESRTEEIEDVNRELKMLNLDLIGQKNALERTLQELRETQAHLVQSEKMASIGVLTAGIAHEINNPLNYIQGGVSALGMYIEDFAQEHMDEVEPMLNSVKEGVRRAAEIVRSFNKFSRHGGDAMVSCNVGEIVDRCLTMIKSETRDRIEIVKSFTTEEYELIANEGKLHQVFINLLLNSCQAIEGEGRIEIGTEIKGDVIRVTVTDDGPGIPQVHLSKVYDPFFTTKSPGEGTGLGLYISNKLVEDHKGVIEIFNLEEGGARAVVELPLRP